MKQPDRAIIVLQRDQGRAMRAEAKQRGMTLKDLGIEMWEAYLTPHISPQ